MRNRQGRTAGNAAVLPCFSKKGRRGELRMKCKFTGSIIILALLSEIRKKDASQESYLTESDIAQELYYARGY